MSLYVRPSNRERESLSESELIRENTHLVLQSEPLNTLSCSISSAYPIQILEISYEFPRQ